MVRPTLIVVVAAILVLTSAQINPPPGAPSTITVQFIIRDFVGKYPNGPPPGANGTTHIDFERIIADDRGIVNTRLGVDRKPVLNTSVVSSTWTNATWFNLAWNDHPGVSYRLTRNFAMPWNAASGLYEYSNSAFFPINGDGFGNYGTTNKNFHFCLEYHTQFQYRGTETFSFTGDDDVYFFVNNILFVDLGGVHSKESASRSLTNTSQALSQYGMTVGNVYNFDFFYCERHTSESNLKMATNILLNDCPFLDACGACTTKEPTSLVDPCTTMKCNNGSCSCQTASCICNPGWINGPLGNCSQKCGDGIIQGSEQCDGGPCCTPQCTFADAGSSCPSQGLPCVTYQCTGNSASCGTPRAVGSSCVGSGFLAQCNEFQCTQADGSRCDAVVNNALSCTDNNSCTTDQCVSGKCVSTLQPCQAQTCRQPGTCDPNTGICSQGSPVANGQSCGADPGASNCSLPTCQNGGCTLTSRALNTPCGSSSADGCSTKVCDGIGAGLCVSTAIVNAQNSKASCTQPDPNTCKQSLCSGLACSSFNLVDGTSCTNGSLSITYPTCQRMQCNGGQCTIQAVNNGAACTDIPLNAFGNDSCSTRVCNNGACIKVADNTREAQACNVGAGANPEPYCKQYTCRTGLCVSANVNESQTCTASGLSGDFCNQLLCVTGTCTKVAFNYNGFCGGDTNDGCVNKRCNATGACIDAFPQRGTRCNVTSDLCNLSTCDGAGTCTFNYTTCPGCGGLMKCDATDGVCKLPSGSGAGACCGDGGLDAGEACDEPGNPCCVGCQWANPGDSCSTNECNPKTCQQLYSPSQMTNCTDNILGPVPCTSAPPVTNQCHELLCGSGSCNDVNKPENTPCTLSGVGFCAMAVCRSGTCTVVANTTLDQADCSSAFGTVPECNKAVCSGINCVLASSNDGGSCVGQPDVECRSRVCSSGACVYDNTAFPFPTVCSGLTASDVCQYPSCDGNGNCALFNTSTSTVCTQPNNPDCNTPRCDGQGSCHLVAINIGSACTTARDAQCQVSLCDVNGNCVVSDVADNTPCTRGDVGQCQDSVCVGGACSLINTANTTRSCAPTPNPAEDRSCFNYFCQADGTCETHVNKPDDTPCTDANMCDTDLCESGVCTHKVSVLCNTPTQPCEVPLGTCISQWGNCTYGGRGQYAACSPRASELDPRCNASNPGEYRCSTGSPDSACVPSCFTGAVCGDGIVQVGEDCDWGDPRTGGPCCNVTCKWFADFAPCNNSDPTLYAAITAQVANLSRTTHLPEICFVQRCLLQNTQSVCALGLDETVSKRCSSTSRSGSNRTAVLASVIPGALLALCLAGLGFYFWRRAQNAAEQEWLQEYLNSGNVRVENNAAFVETNNSVNNAAFQPDGR